RSLCFTDYQRLSTTSVPAYLLLFLLLSKAPSLPNSIAAFGENDIAVWAFAMAATYYAIEYIGDRLRRQAIDTNLILLGISLSLMTATKPTGWLFSLAVMVAVSIRACRKPGIIQTVPVLAGIIMI